MREKLDIKEGYASWLEPILNVVEILNDQIYHVQVGAILLVVPLLAIAYLVEQIIISPFLAAAALVLLFLFLFKKNKLFIRLRTKLL